MQGFRSRSSRKIVVDDNPDGQHQQESGMNCSSKGGGMRSSLMRFGSSRRMVNNADSTSPDRMCASERITTASGRPGLSRRFNNSRRGSMNNQSEPDHHNNNGGERPGLTRRFSNSRRGLMQRQASIGSTRSLKSSKSVRSLGKDGSSKIASLWNDHEGLEIGKKVEKPAPAPMIRPGLGKSLSFRKPKSSRIIVVDDLSDDDWSKELEEEKKKTQGESLYMKIKRQTEVESLCGGDPTEDTCREDDSEFLGMVIGVPTTEDEKADLGLEDLPDLRRMPAESEREAVLGMSMVLEESKDFDNSMHGSKLVSPNLDESRKSSSRRNRRGDDDDDSSAGETTKFGDGTTLGDETTIGDDDGDDAETSVGTQDEAEIHNKIRNLALLSRQSILKEYERPMEVVVGGHGHQAVEVPMRPTRRLGRE